jgi:hypothetical protein
LSSLSVDILHSILSNNSLQIKSEDKLYRFIIVRLCEDLRYSSLLEFIRFEFLSVSSIENFISSEIDFFILLNRSLWDRICHRLILSVSPKSRNDRLVNVGRTFCSTEKSALEGIIAYLMSQHNGNVHERGIVNISALDPYDTTSYHLPKNVADLAVTDTYFFSKNESNQMVIYDFQQF